MRISTLLALLGFAAVPAMAELSDSALGNGGELLSLHAGTYQELFPEGDSEDAGTPILVLEIDAGDGEPARWLVPGTEDARIENRPRLLYAPHSGSTILIWHSQGSSGDLRIDFASYADSGFGAVDSISGADERPVAIDQAAAMVATRDTFEGTLDDGTAISAAARDVIHLAYQASGRTHYTPLVFVAGHYIGWHETLDLGGTFLVEPAGGQAAELTAELARALTLEVAQQEDSAVLITFANPESHRLGTLGVRLLPLRIELLGDVVLDRIQDLADLYDPDDMSNFAGPIRAEIIAIGNNLEIHPGILQFTSEQVGSWIESAGGEYGFGGFDDFGRDARELAIYLSASVTAKVISDPATGDDILEIELGDFLDALGTGSASSQLVRIEVLSDLPAPALGRGAAAMFTSRDGSDLLVGWKPDDKNRVFYFESRSGIEDGAWSRRKSLKLGPALSLEDAIRLLEQKIR